jgi:imidazolonepropionase-like amidohydrolase
MFEKYMRYYLARKLLGCVAAVALLGQSPYSVAVETKGRSSTGTQLRILLIAHRIFDGIDFQSDRSILIEGQTVAEVGPQDLLISRADQVIDLGDATLLPGFIELHAHSVIRNVPGDTILRHGVTTVRDVGGPLLQGSGGVGRLRLLTAGPIITVQSGYPISVFGKGYIAEAVETTDQAKALVRKLVDGGASVIKIALEPGGEPGAPWTQGHHGTAAPPWPMASRETVAAIVGEAHRLGKIVTAHIGENAGATIALTTGVDEWAHVPCLEIDDALIAQAAQRKVKVVTTLDTMSHCPGVFTNARKLVNAGVSLLYGAEIAHTDIPWGIDAQELQLMHHVAGMSTVEVLRAATSEAGKELGMEPLGRLVVGAPADLIAVKGDPEQSLKILEYPDLVISGGVIVSNNFK